MVELVYHMQTKRQPLRGGAFTTMLAVAASSGFHAFDSDQLAQLMPSGAQCLPSHEHVFFHIMKTGGLALDAMLECACGFSGCAVDRRDGTDIRVGRSECLDRPSILALHSEVPHADKWLGSAWAGASNITVLREPVARVWSFYAYQRRWYTPYRERPLSYFLERPDLDPDVEWGLNETGRKGPRTRCEYCRRQLRNMMTYYFGLPEHEFKRCDHVDRAPLTADHLATASRRLRALAYVGFAEDADRLPSDLRRVWPDVFKAVPDGACSLESENPTHYGSLPRSPDTATRALIEAANVHDVALYRGARASWRRTEVLQESGKPAVK